MDFPSGGGGGGEEEEEEGVHYPASLSPKVNITWIKWIFFVLLLLLLLRMNYAFALNARRVQPIRNW